MIGERHEVDSPECERNSSAHYSKPARVLFPFVGDSVGGSHISALELLYALPTDRVQPVVGLHENGPLARFFEERGVDWIALPEMLYPVSQNFAAQMVRMIQGARRLAKILVNERIDIVHTNDRRMHLLWLFAAKWGRTKHVWHQRTKLKSRRIAFYSWFASSVVTISEYVRTSSPKLMRYRAHVIADPVIARTCLRENEHVHQLMMSTVANNEKSQIVVWVGNWTEQKRPWLLPDIAAAMQKDNRISPLFIMLGRASADQRKRLWERARDLNVEDRLIIREFQTPVEPWIANASVLVATAVREGFGRTIIEAMQLGTPVVASGDGGHNEIIEHGVTGELVFPDDPEAFAQAISRILDRSELRERYVENGRRNANERYDPVRHANRITAVYEACES